MRVVGYDISLTSTGMSDGTGTAVIQTAAGERMEERMDRLTRGMVAYALNGGCDLAVIEAPAFSRTGPGHDELAAVRWMARHRLWRLGIPYAMVPPTTLKMATTGYGKATKQQMVAAVDERHMANLHTWKVGEGRYDRADAFALAAMGYVHVGHPLPCHIPAPPIGRQSIAAVTWPDLLSDD